MKSSLSQRTNHYTLKSYITKTNQLSKKTYIINETNFILTLLLQRQESNLLPSPYGGVMQPPTPRCDVFEKTSISSRTWRNNQK